MRAGLLVSIVALVGAPMEAAARQGSEISVADILQVSDIGGLAVSPDGRSLAFRVERADLSSNAYPTRWHIWSEDSGVRGVGAGGDAIFLDPGVASPERPVWSPDSSALFYRLLVGGEVQLWRALADGSGAASVVATDADVASIAPDPAGEGLIFTVGPSREAIRRAEREEYDAGILVDEHVDLAQNLFRGAIINGRPATQRLTGSWFMRAGLLWREPVTRHRLDFRTLASTPMDRAAGTAAPEATPGRPGEAISGSGDVARANSDGGERSIEVARSGGGTVTCRLDACRARASWLAWRRGADEVLFATQDAAWVQTVHLWDVARGRVRTVARSEGLLSGGRDSTLPCAVAREALFCVAAGAASPPRLEQIRIRDGERTTLFDPNDELRRRLNQRLRVERLRWRGAEGHDYTGVLFSSAERPAGRRPLFINYYLCDGFLRGGLGDEWPLAPLAEAGIDALCVTSTAIAGAQDSLANNRAAAEGVTAIVARLDREGRTDTRRVGMGGLSFGSEVTLWTAYNTDLLAAASITSPGLEPSYYWFNGVRGRDNHEKLAAAWQLRAPDETPDRWRQLSAALNADRIRAPLLMQMPEQEARLVTELYARLGNSPTPVELYAFPDEPHIKVQPRHKLAAYQRNLDWFRYWLAGERDPDPRKRGQYERWDSLRARQAALNLPTSAAIAPGSPGRRYGNSGDRPAPAGDADRLRRSSDR